jgi:hypothetical protein
MRRGVAAADRQRFLQRNDHLIWVDETAFRLGRARPRGSDGIGAGGIGQRPDVQRNEVAVTIMQVRDGRGMRFEVDVHGRALIAGLWRGIPLQDMRASVPQPDQIVTEVLPGAESRRIGAFDPCPLGDTQAGRRVLQGGDVVVVEVDNRDAQTAVGVTSAFGQAIAENGLSLGEQVDRALVDAAWRLLTDVGRSRHGLASSLATPDIAS